MTPEVLRPCLCCSETPTRPKLGGAEWVVACGCGETELPSATCELDAVFLWNHGDRDGWEREVVATVQGSLF